MKQRRSLLRNDGIQTLLSSILCIIGGLVIGYLVLLIIEPSGAWDSTMAVIKNFYYYPEALQTRYLGQTIVKTVPLLLCSISVLFAYKVGMFNIGVAGQYVGGACAALYVAIQFNMPWYVCLIAALAAGALLGAITGILRMLCNVNVVISGIMLNWITLYLTNLILGYVKNPMSPYTKTLTGPYKSALIPQCGINEIFNEKSATIAIPIALVIAVIIWIVLNKTKFGYELKATGNNPHAAKYAGMKEVRNIIVTMVIAGGLAGLGAGLFYLTGIEEWETTISSVPAMGFNGIAVAFLGGLDPLGSILSAFFIQHITSGGGNVDLSVYCSQISSLISSLIIFLCAFVPYFKTFVQARIRKSDEKWLAAQKALEDAEGGKQ